MENKVNRYNKINLWLPVVIWAGVIFFFSSLETNPVSKVYWREFAIKKSAHIVEYAIFAVLLYRAIVNTKFTKRKSGIVSALIASFYGITDEFHQSFTPGREPTVRDVIFDTIGAVLAIYFIWKILPKAPKKLKSWAKSLQIL